MLSSTTTSLSSEEVLEGLRVLAQRVRDVRKSWRALGYEGGLTGTEFTNAEKRLADTREELCALGVLACGIDCCTVPGAKVTAWVEFNKAKTELQTNLRRRLKAGEK